MKKEDFKRAYKSVSDRITPDEECRERLLAAADEHTGGSDRRRIKHRRFRGTGAIAAAAVIAICGGTAAAAANSGLFSRISSTLNGHFTDDSGREWDKDKFAPNYSFMDIESSTEQLQPPIPMENDDIFMQAESIYCDGTTLMIGMTASLKDGNAGGAEYINMKSDLYMDGKLFGDISFINVNQNDVNTCYGKLYLDEGTSNSFSGVITVVFQSARTLKEPKDIEVRLSDVTPNSNIYGIRMEDDEAVGDFRFTLHVTPHPEYIREINKTFENGGASITIYSISPAMALVGSTYPEEYSSGTPQLISIWTDDNGNYMEPVGINRYYLGDGVYANPMQPFDTKNIHVVYLDKNSDTGENGSYSFTYDGIDYQFAYVDEWDFDISEIYD
ncbi:MAG: hypothetical protein IJ874_07970 [Ruminococcus sp.]|nr:hypothetical protein [Ruminococcus sp.]